jgi:DNA-binding transcriptional regulator YhcF (GntR family)
MQNIIKRQVQNYILQRMKAGATALNVQQAAKDLGLTPGQIVWAYQTLMQEGWFHVKSSKGKVKETVQPQEEETGTETGTETATAESDQVFAPEA